MIEEIQVLLFLSLWSSSILELRRKRLCLTRPAPAADPATIFFASFLAVLAVVVMVLFFFFCWKEPEEERSPFLPKLVEDRSHCSPFFVASFLLETGPDAVPAAVPTPRPPPATVPESFPAPLTALIRRLAVESSAPCGVHSGVRSAARLNGPGDLDDDEDDEETRLLRKALSLEVEGWDGNEAVRGQEDRRD